VQLKKLHTMIFLVKRNEHYMEETRNHLQVFSKKKIGKEEIEKFRPVISKKEYISMRKLYNEKLDTEVQNRIVSECYQSTMDALKVNRSEIEDDLEQFKKRMKAM